MVHQSLSFNDDVSNPAQVWLRQGHFSEKVVRERVLHLSRETWGSNYEYSYSLELI